MPMTRSRLALVGGVVVVVVVLGVALARVGTQLDEVRIDQADLESEVEELEIELDGALEERDALQTKVDEQLKAIEQLKAELERTRAQAPPASP